MGAGAHESDGGRGCRSLVYAISTKKNKIKYTLVVRRTDRTKQSMRDGITFQLNRVQPLQLSDHVARDQHRFVEVEVRELRLIRRGGLDTPASLSEAFYA